MVGSSSTAWPGLVWPTPLVCPGSKIANRLHSLFCNLFGSAYLSAALIVCSYTVKHFFLILFSKEVTTFTEILLHWFHNFTPNMPLIHTLFTCSKLNMDDFSLLADPLGYADSTQELEWNCLHVQKKSFLLLNLPLCVKIHLSMN